MNPTNPFFLDEDRVLFFDVFHKNNELIVIMPIYSPWLDLVSLNRYITFIFSIPRKLLSIVSHFFFNKLIFSPKFSSLFLPKFLQKVIQMRWCFKGTDLKLNYKKSNFCIKNEPVIILIYELKNDSERACVTFEYNNYSKIFELNHYKTSSRYKLAVAVQFKADYKLIPTFYNYYKSQGVEQFYFYFNGKLTPEIKYYANKPDITLIEWNFKYWFTNVAKGKSIHHGQPPQINHALYRYGKEVSEYMIFCDLDEYLYVPRKTLKELVTQTQKDYYGFRNRWSQTLNGKIPQKLPRKLKTTAPLPFKTYSKCICKTETLLVMGVHFPYKFLRDNPTNITNLEHFHFFNWSKKQRIIPTNQIVKILQS